MTRAAEPGEVVQAGTAIVTLLDLTKVYLRGFVPEGQIGKVAVGQPAHVYLDSNPKQALDAYVSRIDPEATFTPENTYFRDDRVKQVVGLKLQLKEGFGFAKPGMPADGEILVKGNAWPKGQVNNDGDCHDEFRSARRPTCKQAAGHSCRDLWKRYGAIQAVRGISLEVAQGEIFGLIGPDGAGKTSTFQILAGVMEATSGVAEVFSPSGARNAIADRLPHADVQPLSRPERFGKHPLHRRPAARSPRRDRGPRTTLSADVRHGPLLAPARGPTERRHEAKTVAGRRAGAAAARAAAR